MLVNLTSSQLMALADLISGHLQVKGHTEVYIDAARNVETTPEDLLRLLVDVGAGVQSWPDETDRQMLLRALAIAALDAPGFDSALSEIAKHGVRPMITKIALVTLPGQCRWCRCTYDRPCANGCAWADRAQTLCSECAPLDKAMQTVRGRRELAEFVQEHGFLVGQQMPKKARARR